MTLFFSGKIHLNIFALFPFFHLVQIEKKLKKQKSHIYSKYFYSNSKTTEAREIYFNQIHKNDASDIRKCKKPCSKFLSKVTESTFNCSDTYVCPLLEDFFFIFFETMIPLYSTNTGNINLKFS